jgi:hypothetical protein
MYIEENYTEYDHSIGVYSELKLRICIEETHIVNFSLEYAPVL